MASVTGLVAAAAGETGIGGWWPARLCRLHTGQTRQAVLIPPTVQFYAKFCTETILIKQETKKREKKNFYSSHVSSQEHSSSGPLVVSNVE